MECPTPVRGDTCHGSGKNASSKRRRAKATIAKRTNQGIRLASEIVCQMPKNNVIKNDKIILDVKTASEASQRVPYFF